MAKSRRKWLLQVFIWRIAGQRADGGEKRGAGGAWYALRVPHLSKRSPGRCLLIWFQQHTLPGWQLTKTRAKTSAFVLNLSEEPRKSGRAQSQKKQNNYEILQLLKFIFEKDVTAKIIHWKQFLFNFRLVLGFELN